jgi:hypothetical protein
MISLQLELKTQKGDVKNQNMQHMAEGTRLDPPVCLDMGKGEGTGGQSCEHRHNSTPAVSDCPSSAANRKCHAINQVANHGTTPTNLKR